MSSIDSVMTQPLLFDAAIDSGAIISDCGFYRYKLWRAWDPTLSTVNWLMLNPSVANEIDNDPTADKCIRYARSWGYGGIVITNLFALRSTDPKALRTAPDPVGPENDRHVFDAARISRLVLCGWGADKAVGDRGRVVRRMLGLAGITPHCLTMTKGGEPGHPLFLKGNLTPVPMEVPTL